MNYSCKTKNRSGQLIAARVRGALTLIELLIVMGLLIILASISLTAMKELLRGQKVSQASILVRQYLQNAQMRAVSNGRPVAVFLDRVSMAGTGAGSPSNSTVTRMQFGEVFPPYVGDVEEARGQLINTATGLTGFANALLFAPPVGSPPNPTTGVAAGIGTVSGNTFTPGFIQLGDIIEIEGSPAQFLISAITPNPVTPFTPPTPNNFIAVGFGNSEIPLQIPLTGGVPLYRKFKIYRQPTKSLVAALALPRGACVDLSVSGLGLNHSGVDSGVFSLADAGLPVTSQAAGDFSRIGIVFNSQGRLAYIMDESSQRAAPRIFYPAASILYLMIGRTDRVLPGFPTSIAKLAALYDGAGGEFPTSNLLEPESIWVTCNPFTGEVKTAAISSVDPAALASTISNVTANPTTASIASVVAQTRALAASGVSN